MEIWVTERQTPDLSLSIRITSILFHKASHYQDILVVDTVQFGKVLLLDMECTPMVGQKELGESGGITLHSLE